jgi:D-sedoheptulose 7-phosphate isomerase
MTDLAPITNYLCEAIDTTAANIECISPDIEQACNIITQTLLNDRKIIICGNGLSNAVASIFSSTLLNQQEFARPSLPAINISADPSCILSISKSSSQHQIFANQISAIGTEGDTLVALSTDGNCGNIIQAIQAAHEKNINVITITGFQSGKATAILQSDDIDIRIESNSVARVLEIQLLIVNCLCYQLDATLFGSMN